MPKSAFCLERQGKRQGSETKGKLILKRTTNYKYMVQCVYQLMEARSGCPVVRYYFLCVPVHNSSIISEQLHIAAM
jgi:hypothetical protein